MGIDLRNRWCSVLFLDVGGGATVEQVRNAFKIILGDQNVNAVLINIFGGIMRCDVVASGVVEAAKSIGVNIPVVVRLEGTNVEKGQEILQNSGLKFTVADGMKDAAEKVVALATITLVLYPNLSYIMQPATPPNFAEKLLIAVTIA